MSLSGGPRRFEGGEGEDGEDGAFFEGDGFPPLPKTHMEAGFPLPHRVTSGFGFGGSMSIWGVPGAHYVGGTREGVQKCESTSEIQVFALIELEAVALFEQERKLIHSAIFGGR